MIPHRLLHLLAVVAVLALSGCSLLGCGMNATNGTAAGGCQAGTSF
ncbi:hypothetical protein [Paraburkholderia kururiensis]